MATSVLKLGACIVLGGLVADGTAVYQLPVVAVPAVVNCLYGRFIPSQGGFRMEIYRVETRRSAQLDSLGQFFDIRCPAAPDFIGAVLKPPPFPLGDSES